jgi:enoyl-CoA hydratase/carnithine racemase
MDAEKPVLYDSRDGLAVVTLNRPHRLNAINGELLRDLIDALDGAGRDDAVAAVVLTGAGRAFCAGEDLKETAAGKSRAQWAAETDMLQQVQRSVMAMGKPLIAAVRGYAVGGGCEFAMSCDIRIAADDAVFGFPETGLGMTLTTAGTKLLSHLVGLGRAKELILTGDFIDATEALRIGLVNRVVPGDRLMEEAMAMAGRLAERSPLALRLSRAAIDEGLHSSFEETLTLEAEHLMECVGWTEYRGRVQDRLDEMRGSGRQD